MVDRNDDWCMYCKDGGELVCCERCRNTVHVACGEEHNCMSTSIDEWLCKNCEMKALKLQISGLWRQNEELGRQNEELGRQNEELGRQKEKLGRQNEELGRQKEKLGRQNEELGRQKEKLGRQKEKLGRQNEEQGRHITSLQKLVIDTTRMFKKKKKK